ncbi:MAG: septum formation protein Maf [Bacteroidetes bacterium]|nr:septum formation protein Maf [Bacteroidota bacterium]
MNPSILYLASASPRRASLVSLLGVKRVIIKPADIDETLVGSRAPHDFAFDLAFQKASATRGLLHPNDSPGIVLGADTIVVINDVILGKPTDEADARAMLRTLSGATHTVYTGIALLHSVTGESVRFVEKTQVTFRTLGDDEIAAYVAGGSPMDKAGSYGIQDDHGAVFVSRIEGDYYNVVGLPLCSTYVHLRQFAPTLF